jgi:lactoylglutathione lyase
MFQEAFPILSTADLPRALGFYRDLLGFAQTYRFPAEGDPVYVGLSLGPSELGLAADPEVAKESDDAREAIARRFALCVYADDCDAAVDRLRAHSGPVLTEPVNQPWGERMAEVTDLDGNRVVILSRL